MSFSAGIVGLPNSGKSTLFKALSGLDVPIASFPFSTVDPHRAVVPVPEPRLEPLAKIFSSSKITPPHLEFWDIAGLVRGASKGEGLGNRFLDQIRKVDLLVEVIRCFENGQVAHTEGSIDPQRDISILHQELILSDLSIVEKGMGTVSKRARAGDREAARLLPCLEKVHQILSSGELLRYHIDEIRDCLETIKNEWGLITVKPAVFVFNVNETSREEIARMFSELRDKALFMDLKLEVELLEMSPEEMEELGLRSALPVLAEAGYQALDLITFFTANENEAKAWSIERGSTAIEAAARVHSDIAKGFIKVDVYDVNELIKAGSPAVLREQGKFRTEGRDYVVKNDDFLYFHFKV